jgi:RNA polymerase sigma-70 factor (ECF subfamily)
MSTSPIHEAHREFSALVADVRPDLHRYCARMTGSIADGEDLVQETLAKAFYALGMAEEPPALRPWLFRVAHNAAIDLARSHDRAKVDLVAELPDAVGGGSDGVDPETVRAALAAFVALPPLSRGAVILKDVLGHSGEEIAATLEASLPAVKSALVRGRARLREEAARLDDGAAPESGEVPAALDEYARLFNSGDWDGLRARLADDVRLDLVSKSTRRGKAVGFYFQRYAAEPGLRAAPGTLDGRAVLWIFGPKSPDVPAYFIELAFSAGRVTRIKDLRYVPYVVNDLARARHAVAR